MWKKWPIFYGVALTCLLGCLALIYGTYQMEPPQNSSTFIEVTKMIFLCLGGMGVLLPITLSVMNSQEQRKFEKIENTFDLISKWDDEHLLKARNYTREIKKNRKNISDEQLIAQIEENEELEQSVILVTNYFEHVRFSLKQNRIEKELFKSSLGITLVPIIDRFWPYYEKKFKEGCDDLKELKKLLE
jgi:hypothetical protein